VCCNIIYNVVYYVRTFFLKFLNSGGGNWMADISKKTADGKKSL